MNGASPKSRSMAGRARGRQCKKKKGNGKFFRVSRFPKRTAGAWQAVHGGGSLRHGGNGLDTGRGCREMSWSENGSCVGTADTRRAKEGRALERLKSSVGNAKRTQARQQQRGDEQGNAIAMALATAKRRRARQWQYKKGMGKTGNGKEGVSKAMAMAKKR
eukprot:939798-Pelagomonas_calceolata.AAC.1